MCFERIGPSILSLKIIRLPRYMFYMRRTKRELSNMTCSCHNDITTLEQMKEVVITMLPNVADLMSTKSPSPVVQRRASGTFLTFQFPQRHVFSYGDRVPDLNIFSPSDEFHAFSVADVSTQQLIWLILELPSKSLLLGMDNFSLQDPLAHREHVY